MSRLPAVKSREVVAVLKKLGFLEHHQKGSHLYMWHAMQRRMVCVPQHSGDLKTGTLHAIIKQAGITADQFHQML